MLTIDYIQSLDEDQLVDEVLIPLLKAMGFRDVTKHHGGSAEQGKDIICWKTDELGLRRNLAIVAKATPITARANMASGSTGEVLTQIQQAFGKSFIDPVSTEPREVHECWVISSQRILKEAEDSIRSALSTNGLLPRLTTFINGDRLWELVEQYMPISAVWQKLQEASNTLQELDPHYVPQVILEPGAIQVTIAEKPASSPIENPLEITSHFEFPDTPEGHAAHQALWDFVRTGTPVDIPSNYVRSVEFPDPFKELFGPQQPLLFQIRLGGPVNPRPLTVRIEFRCDDGDGFTIPYVELRVKQGGTDEITFTNAEQPLAFKVTLVARLKDHLTELNIQSEAPDPMPVNLALDILRLRRCLSKPYVSKIVYLATEMELFTQRQEEGISTPPHDFLMGVVEDLTFLQKRLGKPILLPLREWTIEEQQTITKLRAVIHEARMETTWDSLKASLLPTGARGVLETFADGKLGVIQIEQSDTEELFGIQLDLGAMRATAWNVRLQNEDQVRKELTSAGNATPIECRFEPGGPNRMLKEYPQWQAGTH